MGLLAGLHPGLLAFWGLACLGFLAGLLARWLAGLLAGLLACLLAGLGLLAGLLAVVLARSSKTQVCWRTYLKSLENVHGKSVQDECSR